MGTDRPESVFEYGDGLLNVRSYKRAVSIEGSATRVWSPPPGFPDNATQGVLMQIWPVLPDEAPLELLDDVITTDLNVETLRTQLLIHHLNARHGPRQTLEFVPVSDLGDRVPRYGVDYELGDRVPFRASVDVTGSDGVTRKRKRIDATMRIYAVSISVDAMGVATPTLTVTPGT
jgi:hypothetical protein